MSPSSSPFSHRTHTHTKPHSTLSLGALMNRSKYASHSMCFSSYQYKHRHYYYTSSELKSSPPPPHTNTHPVTLYNLFQLDFCVHIHKCLFPHTVSYNNMWQCGAVYDRKAHCVRFVWRETYILFLHSVRCME